MSSFSSLPITNISAHGEDPLSLPFSSSSYEVSLSSHFASQCQIRPAEFHFFAPNSSLPLLKDIWLHIATFLTKRTLANLSATCLDLHRLLTPVLMKTVRVGLQFIPILRLGLVKNTWFGASAEQGVEKKKKPISSRALLLKEKLRMVQVLFAPFGPGPFLEHCPLLRKLDIEIASLVEARLFGCCSTGNFEMPHLKQLTLRLGNTFIRAAIEQPRSIAEFKLEFPALVKLVIRDNYHSQIGTAAQKGCPQLESVEMFLGETRKQPLPFFPTGFLSKIKHWEEHAET